MPNSCKNVTATGDVTTGDTMLVAITNGGMGGDVELRDGGSGGTLKAKYTAATGQHINLPGGMRFASGLHATLTGPDDISFWLG